MAAPEAVTPRPWALLARAARDLERLLARESEPLGDVGRDRPGALAQAGGDAARKARLRRLAGRGLVPVSFFMS
jgi:hypothetical protein